MLGVQLGDGEGWGLCGQKEACLCMCRESFGV